MATTKLVGRGELGAERRAEAPAEPAGRTEREEGARLLARAMVRPQRIFVEDDGVLARRASPMTRERYSGEMRSPGAESFASCARRVRMRSVSRRAARGDARLRHLQARLDRRAQRLQRIDGAGLDGEIAREAAHRIAHEERILADMRDAAAGGRMLQAAESTARRIRARSPGRRRPAARPARSRNAWDGSTAGRRCADCA